MLLTDLHVPFGFKPSLVMKLDLYCKVHMCPALSLILAYNLRLCMLARSVTQYSLHNAMPRFWHMYCD